MTEEKEAIYIDGVDVSDCRLRQYNSDLCNGFKMDNSGFHQGHCRQNPNCYYKQLMFANKKLEAAKTEAEQLVSTIWVMSGEITDLRNENERLHNELVEAKGEQLGTLIRYNKILEGIKEVADKYSDSIDKSNDALYWIIDKINEVLK